MTAIGFIVNGFLLSLITLLHGMAIYAYTKILVCMMRVLLRGWWFIRRWLYDRSVQREIAKNLPIAHIYRFRDKCDHWPYCRIKNQYHDHWYDTDGTPRI